MLEGELRTLSFAFLRHNSFDNIYNKQLHRVYLCYCIFCKSVVMMCAGSIRFLLLCMARIGSEIRVEVFPFFYRFTIAGYIEKRCVP